MNVSEFERNKPKETYKAIISAKVKYATAINIGTTIIKIERIQLMI